MLAYVLLCILLYCLYTKLYIKKINKNKIIIIALRNIALDGYLDTRRNI